VSLEPDPAVNVLVGPNGAGKTTILEGIAYLSQTRSFRGVPDETMVRRGERAAVIRGRFLVEGSVREVGAEIPMEGRRRILLDGKRPRRLRDVMSLFPIVAFQPDDLDLVKGGPGRRRGYLDDLAAMLWPQAAVEQTEAERALRQRNALLRDEGRRPDDTALDVWDEKYAIAGAAVFETRHRLIGLIADTLEQEYAAIAGGGELAWWYAPAWREEAGAGPAALRAALRRRRDRDRAARTTTVGPHRDDPVLMLDGRPARTTGSQGEQRTAALVLRLAAGQAIERIRGVAPVVLLDDVFSELDTSRMRRVVAGLPRGQVFVTTARDDEVPLEGRRWQVTPGSIDRGGSWESEEA